MLLFTAFLTAYYTFRLYFRVFEGPLVVPPEAEEHIGHVAHHAARSAPVATAASGVDPHLAGAAHEEHTHHDPEPPLMIYPLYVLAAGALLAGFLNTPWAQGYANDVIGKWFKTIPPGGAAAPQAASTFTYGYFVNTWGLIKGLEAVKGDLSGNQKALQQALAKVTLPAPYGQIKLDANRQAVTDIYAQQLYTKNGKLAVKTVARIPQVDQTFGGTFSASTPAPGRNAPKCEKRNLPWLGKSQSVPVVG